MNNYTLTPSRETPGEFTLQNERGESVAHVRGEAEANVFAHVPELLEFLDKFVGDGEFPYYDAVELKEKLKQYRP